MGFNKCKDDSYICIDALLNLEMMKKTEWGCVLTRKGQLAYGGTCPYSWTKSCQADNLTGNQLLKWFEDNLGVKAQQVTVSKV